jgi:hypothetical protein
MWIKVRLRGRNSLRLMSALGQNRTLTLVQPMSALPPKADIGTQSRNVRFVPKADMIAYSITSSARASSVAGISRPSDFAVLRLIANSNLVGCWTGKSAGFSPLRIRPAYFPAN